MVKENQFGNELMIRTKKNIKKNPYKGTKTTTNQMKDSEGPQDT